MVNNEQRHVLITGGAGYIGANITRILLDQGHRVRILDNLTYGSQGIADLRANANLEVIVGDLRDRKAVGRAVQGIDDVAHMASLVGQPACNLDLDETYQINTEGTRLVTEAAKTAGVRRLLLASTCSVYGYQDGEMVEDSPPCTADDPYAESKRQAEEIVLRAADKLSPRIVRMGTVYGQAPRMRFDLVVNLLSGLAVRKGEFTVIGGDAWRPFVHVWDVARAVVAVIHASHEKADGQIFNVGDSRDNRTINQIADLIAREVPGTTIKRDLENPDGRNYFVSFRKIMDRVGFEHSIEVYKGVRDIVDYLKRRPEIDPQARIFSNVGWLESRQE